MKFSEFKVLLIYANSSFVLLMPISVSSLAAKLKEAGFNVRLFDTTFYKTDERKDNEYRENSFQVKKVDYDKREIKEKGNYITDLHKVIDEYKPDIIGLSTVEVTHRLGIELLESISTRNIKTIVGGVHTTFNPDEVLAEECVDMICVGEGETAMLELCKKMAVGDDYTGVPNLWVKLDGKVIKNKSVFLEDISLLPVPDFNIFDPERIYRQMDGVFYRMVPVEISRGCIYDCTYCSAPSLAKLFGGVGAWFRAKSIDQVFKEIDVAVEKYQAEYFYMVSETFLAMKKSFFGEFIKRYSKIKIPFWFNTRPETLNEEVVGMLEDVNCHRMSIGIESGNEDYRRVMLKRNISNEKILEKCKIVEKSKIQLSVNNIIGFPDETREMVFDTINLNRCFSADSHSCTIFQPLGGTPLKQYCIEKGYVDADFNVDNLYEPSLEMSSLTKEEIKGLYKTFQIYLKCDESEFHDVQKAEKDTEQGNEIFKHYINKLNITE